jgi:hypothetical protein
MLEVAYNRMSTLFGRRIGQYVLVGIAVALLIASLWLPPIALGSRLFHWNVPMIRAGEGGSVSHPTGARVDVAPAVLQENVRVSIEAIDATGTAGVVAAESLVSMAANTLVPLPRDAGAASAMASLPGGVTLYSPFYRITTYGSASNATLYVPLPREIASIARADLYAWNGESWQWVPSHATTDSLLLESQLTGSPAWVAVGAAHDGGTSIGMTLDRAGMSRAPEAGLPVSLTVEGWTLGDAGQVAGDAPARASLSSSQVLVSVSNRQGNVVRTDLVGNLLIDAALVQSHAQALAARVASEGYDGLELSYTGVDPALRAEFTAMASALGDTLRAQGLVLAVRIPLPTESGTGYDTGAYDWRSIGSIADIVRLPIVGTPEVTGAGQSLDRLFTWAVGEVHRSRLELVASSNSYSTAKGQTSSISYAEALGRLGAYVQVENPAELLLPGQTLRFSPAAGSERTIELDAASQMSWFRYTEGGQEHLVWLENARSLVHKLQYARTYALRGALVESVLAEGNDVSLVSVLGTWQEGLIAPEPEYAVRWLVQDTDGNVIRETVTSLEDPRFAWVAPQRPGDYEVSASISDDGGQTGRGIVAAAGVRVPTNTPTPTLTPTAVPTNTPVPTATATATL